MCDLIRQGDVQAKYAIAQIRKKMNLDNVNSVMFSLQCLESIVKNCGSKVHQEIASRDFMDGIRAVALAKTDPIKSKILELVQCWSHAFRKNPNYKIVEDYFNSMKLEGFQFSALKESEAMFDVEEAPAWKEDSECQSCFRCRTEFSTLKRRHHCRACGQIFCNACSSKTAPIPKYGIEKEVRVCDLCYEKLKTNPTALTSASGGGDQLPIEYLNSALFKETKTTAATTTTPVKKSAEKTEQEFEEELQLALALSQSEAEAAESMKKKKSSIVTNNTNNNKLYPNNLSQFKDDLTQNSSTESFGTKQSKSKLSWQQEPKSEATNGASAPYLENVKMLKTDTEASAYNDEEIKINNEIDEFVDELKKILELYINRMKSDSLRGRSITNDTAVQSLFLQLQQMHPKLLSFIKYQEDARGYYENLQDKLTQLKDAREALNALRHENYEKKKRDSEERERLRQVQIAQKLQHMRQQKQSYYQYQNQLNLQHLQSQERDLQMRLEQQRQLVMKRDQLLSNGLPFQSIMGSNDPMYNPMLNQNTQMLYQQQQQQMPQLMNNMPINPYPQQYIDPQQQQYQSLPSVVPNGNMVMNGQQNGLKMVDNLIPNFQQIQLSQQQLPQQQSNIIQQQQPVYLNQQQQQPPVQYQPQLAQMSLNNQQLMYQQQQQIQHPQQHQMNQQQYQYQQAPINNIQTDLKENAIKEAQLISFD